MTAVIARIALRYLAGALVTAGYIDPAMGQELGMDPDILMLVGTGIAFATEAAYFAARKFGWTK